MSKNKKPPDRDERLHIASLKAMQWCACCDQFTLDPEIHEPRQGQWFLAVPLCASCHRGDLNGLKTGLRGMWAVNKLDEWGALEKTIRRRACDRTLESLTWPTS